MYNIYKILYFILLSQFVNNIGSDTKLLSSNAFTEFEKTVLRVLG